MRSTANFILVIFFVILSLVTLLTGSLKFQLLDYNFWQKSFDKNNVYQNLAIQSNNFLEAQIGKEGGSKNDVKVFTDLITTDNVKDFVDKNIQNILSFANGRSQQIIVYVPLRIIPKALLPKNLSGIKSEIPLQDLLTKFNYQNYKSLPVENLAQAGRSATLAFVISVFLLAVTLFLLVLLVKQGDRFMAPGTAILLSGILTCSISKIGGSLKTISSGSLPGGSSFASILVGNLTTPLIMEFMKTWSMVGIILIVIGLVLFFVRKPRYNRSK